MWLALAWLSIQATPNSEVLAQVQSSADRIHMHLKHDELLSHTALCVAEQLLAGKPLSATLTRQCAVKFGVFDNLLLPLSVVESSGSDLSEHIARHLEVECRKRRANTFGAAVLARDGLQSFVLIATERRGTLVIDVQPQQPDDIVVFHGGLGLNYLNPRAVMTTPYGEVREVPLTLLGRREFLGQTLLPHEKGRYQIEIIAFSSRHGPQVIANQALFVGASAVDWAPKAHPAAPPNQPPTARLLDLMNEVRAASGLAPLMMDQVMIAVAQAHAEDMQRRGYFGHDSPEATPFMRMQRADLHFSRAAENIAEASSPDDAHETLMLSPGHRKNIIDPDLDHVGIGVVASTLSTGAPRWLVVIDFAKTN